MSDAAARSQPDAPPGSAEIARFAIDIGRAIRLRQMFYLRQMDEDIEKSGGRIIYAADSNILYQFFRVDSGSPDGRFRAGPYQVFRGPNKTEEFETSKTIGRVITRYILQSLKPNGVSPLSSLLLLPGHDEEARNLYDQIVANFHSQLDRTAKAKLLIIEYLDALEKAEKADERIAFAVEWEPRIYKLLYELGGPHENFREYHELLSKQRLMKLPRAAQESSISMLRRPDTGRHVFSDYQRRVARDSEAGAASWWDRRLKGLISTAFLAQDTKALVALDNINYQLRDHNARVVLITTNEAIIDKGMEYKPFKYSDEALSQYSFSDLYLRHPQCFLCERAITDASSAQNGADTATMGWLDAFLSEVIDRGPHVDLLSFRERCQNVGEREPIDMARRLLDYRSNRHEMLYRDWENCASQLVAAHSSASKIAIENITACVRGGLGGKVRILEQFNDYVTNLTEDSWNSFFLTATQSGYDLVGLSHEVVALPRRRVPALVLRNIPGGERLAKLMNEICGPTRNRTQIVELLSDLGARSQDDEGKHTSGYVRTLGYALLFAYADRWSIAKLIAQRAVHIARRIKRSPSLKEEIGNIVTGREAFYFAAVAQRLTARSAADLDVCAALIQEAREAEKSESDFNLDGDALSDADNRFSPLTGLRMETEEITLDVSRLLFRYFCDDPNPIAPTEAGSQARANMRRIENLLSRRCENKTVRSNARITLRDDYFALILVLEASDNLQAEDRRKIRNHLSDQLNDFEESCCRVDPFQSQNRELFVSVVDIVTCRYAASFGADTERLLEVIEHKYRFLEEIRDPRFRQYLMPYDRASFAALRRQIAKHESAQQ